jgi:hypothetical protein
MSGFQLIIGRIRIRKEQELNKLEPKLTDLLVKVLSVRQVPARITIIYKNFLLLCFSVHNEDLSSEITVTHSQFPQLGRRSHAHDSQS